MIRKNKYRPDLRMVSGAGLVRRAGPGAPGRCCKGQSSPDCGAGPALWEHKVGAQTPGGDLSPPAYRPPSAEPALILRSQPVMVKRKPSCPTKSS